jgi:hypothetical protein
MNPAISMPKQEYARMCRLPLLPVLLTAVALAAPASSQIVGRTVYEPVGAADPFLGNGVLPAPSTRDELRDIDRRIDRGRASGTISRREARQLRREARAIARLDRVYRQSGLSSSEQSELQARTLALRSVVNRPRTIPAPPAPSGGR